MSAIARKSITSVAWIIGTFLLLSWCLYAASDYDQNMLAAVTGERGIQPTLAGVAALEAQKAQVKTIQEADAINGKIVDLMNRYEHARKAELARRQLTQRLWALWGFSAVVPLLLLWWPILPALLRRLQTRSVTGGETANSR